MNKGIDIDHQDKKEMSPLDFAKQIKDMEMINILTDKNLSSKYQSKKLL